MMRQVISALLLLCLVALVAATRLEVTKAGSNKYQSQWTAMDGVNNKEQHVVLGFAIKQNNLDVLNTLFWEVSDPRSKLYGNYLSTEELAELVGADDESITQMTQWLADNNAKSVKVSITRDYIWATFTHKEIEELLHITLNDYVYNDARVNKRAIITRSKDSPSVPAQIASNLDFISGVWHFPAVDTVFKKQFNVDEIVQQDAPEMITSSLVAPYVLQVSGVPEAIVIYYFPMCSGGNVSEVVVNPCSDYGNPITTYQVNTTQYDYNQQKYVTQSQTFSPDTVNCTIDVTIFGDFLYCMLTVPNLLDDVNVTSSFLYCFQDGTCTSVIQTSGNGGLNVVPSVYHNPTDVRAHYGIPEAAVGTAPSNSQAVTAFIYQFFSPADLAQFFKEFDLPSATVQKIIGPNNPPYPGAEASLDIQYIMGIGQGVNTWFWSMGGTAWIGEWAQAVLNTADAPWVHSISYGESESAVASQYLERTETELQKLGVSGRSVMVASGDDGSGDSCTDPVYDVSWPASSPHVTAVGATRITRGATQDCLSDPGNSDCATVGEVSASFDLGIFWTTGGGFSTVYPAPTYQQGAVSNYFSTSTLPPQSMWNRTGRGYPDVAAVGHFLEVVDAGVTQPIDGTSAASPIFAGVISLLNDARLAAGKKTLGFLNPWLYSLNSTDAFYDVTVGDTTYCQQGVCCNTSFVAGQGWDAASGLGTPNFPVLLKQAMSLP